jgi:hypothetical protein
MIAEGSLPTTMAHHSCSLWTLMGGFFGNRLPAASFLLAMARISHLSLQAQSVLHLFVGELDGDTVLRRNFCDHPLPFDGAGTRNARSVFLNGHLQAKEDCSFSLVEHGDDAPTVDDGNLPVQRVRNISGLAVNFPDACRGNLIGELLLLLLRGKPLLCEIGPVGVAVRIARRADVQRI